MGVREQPERAEDIDLRFEKDPAKRCGDTAAAETIRKHGGSCALPAGHHGEHQNTAGFFWFP